MPGRIGAVNQDTQRPPTSPKPRWRVIAAVVLVPVASVGVAAFYAKLLGHNSAGISRSVVVARLPDTACVVAALRETPCVTEAHSSSVRPDVRWEIAPHFGRRKETPGYDVVSFSCADASGKVLLLAAHDSSQATLSLDSTTYGPGDLDPKYPPERLERIRHAMTAIYASMALRCGPLPAPSEVVETTHRTREHGR